MRGSPAVFVVAGVAGAVLLGGVGVVAWTATRPTEEEPGIESPVDPPSEPRRAPHIEPEVVRGPNGRPIEGEVDEADLRKEGLPPRPEPVEPTDAEGWADRRAAQDQAWRVGSLATARKFCAERGITGAEREAVLDALTVMHDALAQIRTGMQDGTVHVKEGRRGMERVRSEAREKIVAAIGEEQTAALNEALSVGMGGGF